MAKKEQDIRIKEYVKKNGEKAYMFKLYLGIDQDTKKPIRTTRRGFRTQREARLAIADLELNGLSKPESEPQMIHTYEQIYNLWYEEYKTTVKASTLLKTERVFKNHILPAFGNKPIQDIKPMDAQNQMNIWHKKLVRASMVMNYAGLVFDYAIRMQLINMNPTKVIKKPVRKESVREDKDMNFYDKDELKKFMAALENNNNFRSFVYFRLLAFTGMRKGESLALKWSDIDLEKQTLYINKAVSRSATGLYIQTPKTPSSIRRISIDDKTVSILQEYKKKSPDGLVFQSEDGGILSPAKPRKWYLTAMKNLPDDFKQISIHGFRHTHASLLFEAGASIKDVQSRLGHSDIQTTMDVYTHVSKTAKEQLANRFNNYVDF
ncbi:tyrosine-type recombinase/integrase [Enterococcus gallinarum]|uniref:Tyrosine-type recombinase/integrase n=1 Tax=Enterococcus gallinarum TaxID=1353 RepID=A0A6I4XFB1_ENTGA|nr:site-specific integrase [Enterococcus gallinarum]MXS25246.1 tyrosine-type recombinase/integrase [Enterococcus gallinarum]